MKAEKYLTYQVGIQKLVMSIAHGRRLISPQNINPYPANVENMVST